MDEEGKEDGETERGVCVVCGVGDEAFWDFVQGDCGAGLEADGEEDVGRDVVVMWWVVMIMIVIVIMVVIMVMRRE